MSMATPSSSSESGEGEDLTGVASRCLVCGGISLSAHFGARTCRACAAFFRRCVALNCRYTCKRANRCPIATTARSSCRSCRFKKCLDVGMQETGVQLTPAETNNFKKSIKREPSASPPTTPESNYLENLCHAYAQLNMRRRAVHGEPPPRMVSAAELNQMHLSEIKLIAEFPKEAFPECEILPNEQMDILQLNFFLHFSVIEVGFNTYPTGQCEVLHFPNNTRHNITDPRSFMRHGDGTPNEHALKVAKLFERHYNLHLHLIHKPMVDLQLDETEMLAVGALLFWLKEIEGLSERVIEMANRAQQRIVAELLEYIRRKEKGRDAAIRLSQLVLLVSNTQKMAHDLRSVFEMHKALGLYKVDNELFEAINGAF